MSTFPLRLLSLLGVLIASGGIGFGGLLMVLRFVYGAVWAAEGVFTLFAFLFIFIGAQFIGLGLLGEYIGRIYHDVRCRPRFFIQEIRGAHPSPTANKNTLSNRNTDHEFRHMTLISGRTYESSCRK